VSPAEEEFNNAGCFHAIIIEVTETTTSVAGWGGLHWNASPETEQTPRRIGNEGRSTREKRRKEAGEK